MENNIHNSMDNILKKYAFMKKPFIYLVGLYLLGISAIIRANFNYIDDILRIADGSKGWENYSRYMSNILSTVIHADNYLTDVSPLTEIISVVILALLSVITIYVLSSKEKITIWNILAVLPIGLTPYFLQCLSYKFDAPYMALSMLACVAPLLLREKGNKIYALGVIAGIIIMCTTYQAASGVFPMLVIFITFKRWNEGKEETKACLKFIIVSAISCIAGFVIFKLFIMKSANTYVCNELHELNNLIPGTLANYKNYFYYVRNDFKKEWLVLIGLMIVSYIYLSVRDSKQNKMAAFILSCMAIGAAGILSLGAYPLLKMPLYEPRGMYGIGAFIAFLGVAITMNQKGYVAKMVCVILSWVFFVFSFTYGNALAIQDKYTDFRVMITIEDLNDLEIMRTNEIKKVQVSGAIGLSPVIQNMGKNYGMLNRLVPIQFKEDWGIYYFYRYFAIKNIIVDGNVDLKTMELPILKDTMYHTIRGDANHLLIELK